MNNQDRFILLKNAKESYNLVLNILFAGLIGCVTIIISIFATALFNLYNIRYLVLVVYGVILLIFFIYIWSKIKKAVTNIEKIDKTIYKLKTDNNINLEKLDKYIWVLYNKD